MKRPALLLPCLLAAAVLAACGKHDAPASAASTAAAPAHNEASAPAAPERRDAKPMDAYELIDLSPSSYPEPVYQGLIRQVRAAFWSAAPKDMDKLAYDYVDAYRQENDSFKRADIVKAHATELEQDLATAQQRRDYAVRNSSLMQVYPYDAATGSFKIAFSTDGESSGIGVFKNAGNPHPYGAWNFRFVGIPTMASGKSYAYHPKNEDEARAIEAILASQRSAGGGDWITVLTQYEGHTLGTIPGPGKDDAVILGIDAITAVDRKTGKPLFSLGGKDLGPIEVKCSTTRKALNLAEPAATGAGWNMAASSESPC
nr:hypothetical protein [Dyella sp. ASV24]